MTTREREKLEWLRDYCRRSATGYPPCASTWSDCVAALDAALRKLDAAAALQAELPGLIKGLSVSYAVHNGQREESPSWDRLCELLPGLAAPAEGGTP